MTGTEFGQLILGKRGEARETALLNAVKNGQYPSVFGDTSTWRTVRLNAVIDGKPRALLVQVAPDFFAVGNDTDPFYVGGWTTTAQRIADTFGAVLPTHKIANEIQQQADLRVGLMETTPGAPWYKPGGIPGDIEHSGAFIASNVKRNARLNALAGPSRWKKLVAGHMKDILTKAGGLSGKCPGGQCVTIYGGLGGGVDGWAIQGKNSTSHTWNYGPDYSHGIRLVSQTGKLDTGESVSLIDIARDPKLHVLVSDEGPIADLRLPSPGASSVPGAGGGGGSAKPAGDVATRAAGGSAVPWIVGAILAIGGGIALFGGGDDEGSRGSSDED